MESTAIVPKGPVVGSEDMEKAEVIASGSTDIISTTSTATTTAAIGSVQEESVNKKMFLWKVERGKSRKRKAKLAVSVESSILQMTPDFSFNVSSAVPGSTVIV